jgi:hypothetical protein
MPKTPGTEQPPGKEKSIMDAVSALTSLGDEEDSNNEESGGASNPPPAKKIKLEDEATEESKAIAAKRFIPEHKKPDAALTFPEKVWDNRQASLMVTEYLHVESVPETLYDKLTCADPKVIVASNTTYHPLFFLTMFFLLSLHHTAHGHDAICRRTEG